MCYTLSKIKINIFTTWPQFTMSLLRINKKVNKLLITLYVLMVLGLLGSLGVAIYQNWQLKYKSTQIELAREAGIGNFVVENAILSAAKSLHAAQQAIQPMINGGPLSAAQAHDTLQNSLNEFKTYSNSTYGGLLLYLDRQGELLARTDEASSSSINLSDRLYFLRLRQNLNLERTISPMVKARTTGEWVFHVAVALKDKHGDFQGVLAQQIQASDIAKDLSKYLAAGKSVQMVSQSPMGISFAYPLQRLEQEGPQRIETPYADFARRSTAPQDAFTWPPSANANQRQTLVGYAHSEQSGLLTTIEHPLNDLWLSFLTENLPLISIAGIALILITGIFLHLHHISDKLSDALHDAFFDALTQIPNRRAFDDMYPRLLRDAMRSQEPMSVLFMDIDHFKNFNDDYGHDGGDIALKAVARTIHACAARPLDFVCRWGGEEFVAILPRTSEAAATLLAQKILAAVRTIALRQDNGTPMRSVSVSIGIASGRITSKELGEHLVCEADATMLLAKQAGRNRYVVHTPHADEPCEELPRARA